MFKKILSILLVAAMMLAMGVALTSCGGYKDDGVFRLGVILLHDEFSTYDLNFLNGINEAAKALGLTDEQLIIKKNIGEDNNCYEAACDLVDQGCDVIFADSFGHETFLLKAAKEYPQVEFCHATGNGSYRKAR